MNKVFIVVILGLGFIFYQPVLMAKTFGGAEYTYLEDDNFIGAANDNERIAATTVYLGHYQAIKNKPTALVFKGSVQNSRFDTVEILDNTIYGLSVGIFHQIDKQDSMVTSLDVLSRKFDADQLNGEIYKLKMAFKQKQSSNFSVKETLFSEYGDSTQEANTYFGFGVGIAATWILPSSTAINTGFNWNRKIYDIEAADVRTNQQLALGVVQSLGKHLYLRLGLSRKRNQVTNSDRDFYNTLLSAGAGLKF